METHIAEITDFQIYQLNQDTLQPTTSGKALSAVLKLKINGRAYKFGGRNLFASLPNTETSDFTGHFILRCMQVAKASRSTQLFGEIVKAHVDGEQVLGIAPLESDDYFYPVDEFERLEKGTDD